MTLKLRRMGRRSLVAAELERRREEALLALRRAEEESQADDAAVEPLAVELRKRWDEARPGVRRMWDEGSFGNVRKKDLLRIVIVRVLGSEKPSRSRRKLQCVTVGCAT